MDVALVPTDFLARLDDLVVERLVVSFCMIMRQELPNKHDQGLRSKLVVIVFELLGKRRVENVVARHLGMLRENGPKSVVDCVRN